MAPEQDSGKRVGRKLIKKRKPQRSSSLQYPERLKVGNDEHEDVTAAQGMPAQQMNQSVFSMIAAAGSKVDFNARFEDGSSDSEEETELSTLPYGLGTYCSHTLSYFNLQKGYSKRLQVNTWGTVKSKSTTTNPQLLYRNSISQLPKKTTTHQMVPAYPLGSSHNPYLAHLSLHLEKHL